MAAKTKDRNERQFDEYRDWQWIKHLILTEYTYLWAEIVGRYANHIFAVDTCAGRGTYTDPDSGAELAEGSSVIFGKRAQAYTKAHGPGRSMRVICCERNSKNYAALVENVARFAPHVTTLRGSFRRHVGTITEKLGTAPALVLVDPIGVASIPADEWEPLRERPGKTDLFVVLHFAGVHRVGGLLLPDGTPNQHIATARGAARKMDRVFKTRDWRDIAIDPMLAGEDNRIARERLYVQLFFDNVIGTRYDWPCTCEVRARFNSPIKYWLVHASNDVKPFELMNDQVFKVNEILLRREYGDGVIEGFVDADLEAEHARALKTLEQRALAIVTATGAPTPFGAIRRQLAREYFGTVKFGIYWKAVKELVKAGKLEREKRPHAAADEHELIWLPDMQPPDPGAAVIPIRRAA